MQHYAPTCVVDMALAQNQVPVCVILHLLLVIALNVFKLQIILFLGVCPYGHPYVDPLVKTDEIDESKHSYLECSGQGECDRASGICQCHPGYTGDACQREKCPNDCSGHGVCTAVKYMTYHNGIYEEVDDPYNYNFWDGVQSHICKCDDEYTGYDCSEKKCPIGYMSLSDCDTPLDGNTQTITMTVKSNDTITFNDTDEVNALMGYLQYTDPFGRVWFSDAFNLMNVNDVQLFIDITQKDTTNCTGAENPIPYTLKGWKNVLNSFPPGTINVKDIEIYNYDSNNSNGRGTCISSTIKECNEKPADITTGTPGSQDYIIRITYGEHQTGSYNDNIEILTPSKVSAEQKSIEGGFHGLLSDPIPGCLHGKDTDGKAYKIYKKDYTVDVSISTTIIPPPTKCAGNGLCDTLTGLCQCFSGYYGLACTEQEALL